MVVMTIVHEDTRAAVIVTAMDVGILLEELQRIFWSTCSEKLASQNVAREA